MVLGVFWTPQTNNMRGGFLYLKLGLLSPSLWLWKGCFISSSCITSFKLYVSMYVCIYTHMLFYMCLCYMCLCLMKYKSMWLSMVYSYNIGMIYPSSLIFTSVFPCPPPAAKRLSCFFLKSILMWQNFDVTNSKLVEFDNVGLTDEGSQLYLTSICVFGGRY